MEYGKKRCEKPSNGFIYRGIVRFMSIANLGFGPFRSGSWRVLMQDTLQQLSKELTFHHPDFQAAALAQQRWEPTRNGGSPINFRAWWESFVSLPSCTGGAPPVLKLSRFWSISQSWRYFRGEIFLLKLVLQEMAGMVDLHDARTLWDANDAQVANKQSSTTSRLARAPGYCNDDTFIAMEFYTLVTHVLEKHNVNRYKILNCDDWVAQLIKDLDGDWQNMISETLRHALGPNAASDLLFSTGAGTFDGSAADLLLDFVVGLITEYCTREIPTSRGYPNRAARLLDPTLDAEASRDELVTHWSLILMLEQLAQQSLDAKLVYDDIVFAGFASNRLLWAIAEREQALGIVDETYELARALIKRLGDELTLEHFHQHIRDTERPRRCKRVSAATCYQTCQVSGVLETRCPSVVSVSLDDIASRQWRTLSSKEALGQRSAASAPSVWPHAMDGILKPKTWPTLSVPSQFSAVVTFEMILDLHQGSADGITQVDVAYAWWSRLLRPKDLCKSDAGEWFLVLAVGKFGAVGFNTQPATVDLPEGGDGVVLRKLHEVCARPLSRVHVASPDDYIPYDYTAIRTAEGILLKIMPGQAGANLLQSALLRRYPWTMWELQRSLLHYDEQPEAGMPATTMRSQLIQLAFTGDVETTAKVEALYKKEPACQPDCVADPEMQDLISEMVEQDFQDATDLRQVRADLPNQAIAELARKRRAARAAAAGKRAARKENSKKAKQNQVLRFLFPPFPMDLSHNCPVPTPPSTSFTSVPPFPTVSGKLT